MSHLFIVRDISEQSSAQWPTQIVLWWVVLGWVTMTAPVRPHRRTTSRTEIENDLVKEKKSRWVFCFILAAAALGQTSAIHLPGIGVWSCLRTPPGPWRPSSNFHPSASIATFLWQPRCPRNDSVWGLWLSGRSLLTTILYSACVDEFLMPRLSQHEVVFNWYLDFGGKDFAKRKNSYFLFLLKQISVHKITVEVELSQRPRRALFTLLELLFIKKKNKSYSRKCWYCPGAFKREWNWHLVRT